jgi:diguanylate cyclase
MLMAIYMVGAWEMVRLTFNSAINQRLLKQKFEELARLDPMTGVCNRSALATDLPRIVAEGKVAVHAIDLDHFKAANDRFGHPVGDALLKQVADRVTRLAGEGDLFVRMGGDEFILVQRRAASCDDAEAMAMRICAAVTAPYKVAGHDIVLGVSIGIALAPHDGVSSEMLLSRSDKALYQAKTYRGGYVFARDLPAASGAHPRAA